MVVEANRTKIPRGFLDHDVQVTRAHRRPRADHGHHVIPRKTGQQQGRALQWLRADDLARAKLPEIRCKHLLRFAADRRRHVAVSAFQHLDPQTPPTMSWAGNAALAKT